MVGKGAIAKAKSRSSRAGLQFPVGRIHRLLKKGHYCERIGGMLLIIVVFPCLIIMFQEVRRSI